MGLEQPLELGQPQLELLVQLEQLLGQAQLLVLELQLHHPQQLERPALAQELVLGCASCGAGATGAASTGAGAT